MNNRGITILESMLLILAALFLLTVSTITLNQLLNDQEVKIEPIITPEITKEKEEKEEKEDIPKLENEYQKLEVKLTNTAKTYISSNELNTENLKITTKELIKKEYMTELVDPKNKNNICVGYVTVNNDEYKSYLRCYNPKCEEKEDNKCENSYQTENYNQEFE